MLSKKIMDVFRGVCIAYLFTIAILVTLAYMVYQFEMGEGIVNGGIIITYILTTFLGGMYVGKRIKEKRFLWGIILGSLYFFILLIVSYLINRDGFTVSEHMISTWCLCIGGGMLGGMFS